LLARVQDVLSRIMDSVVGFWRADFMDKTTDNADLCASFGSPDSSPN